MTLGTFAVRQTRIFAPPRPPYDIGDARATAWSDTLLGAVVAPLACDASVAWFWFSRYADAPGGDDGDCDVSRLPDDYRWDVPGVGPQHRSVRFRYALPASEVERFEADAGRAISAAGALTTDFRPYPWADDLGSVRFVGEDAGTAPEQRAELIATFLHATARLVLDCLVGPDGEGRYRPEANHAAGSSFRTPLHLFANASLVPVMVDFNGETIRIQL